MNYYIFDKEIKNNSNINNPNAQQNNNQFKQNQDFLYPKISNQSKPLNKSHENYIFDRNAELFFNQNKGNYMNPVNTRALDSNKQSPVQQSFHNDFYMSNYETINFGQEKNMYLDRNPVNTRRDEMEKMRNVDQKTFLDSQGGHLNNFTDFNIKNTRTNKKSINTSSYIPNAMTMAIPKENI